MFTLSPCCSVLYGIWLLGLPFINFMSLALDPWVREKTVKSLSLLISTAAYVVVRSGIVP